MGHGGPAWRALLAEVEQRGLFEGEAKLLASLSNDTLQSIATDALALRTAEVGAACDALREHRVE